MISEQTDTSSCAKQLQPRVLLWAIPRSVSTAFFRAMTADLSVKSLLEPYSKSYYFGEERISTRYEDEPIIQDATYADIKALYETPYPDHKAVFAKDMAYYLNGRLTDSSYIPAGYQHTFIIRNPEKTCTSLYKLSIQTEKTGWTHFDEKETGFAELLRLYEIVVKESDQRPIILDADDLLRDPESYVKEYCKLVGIQFKPEMIQWNKSEVDVNIYNDWMPWFEVALTSSAFKRQVKKSSPSNVSEKNDENRPEAVQQAIDACMPYYLKLYNERLVVPNPGSVDIIETCRNTEGATPEEDVIIN